MMSKRKVANDPCGFCAAFGYYIPWSMILAGGIVGAIPALSFLAQSSAYVIAGGMILLAGSTVLNHIGKISVPRL